MNKRILFFLTTMTMGGAERQSIDLARKLNARGWDCRFLSFFNGYSSKLLDDEMLARTDFIGGRRLRDVSDWKRCWAKISDFDPQIVVAVNESPLRISVLGRLSGAHTARSVCTFHSTIIASRTRRVRFPLFRWTLPFADCLIYVSHRQRAYWRRRWLRSRRDVVIPNGVDVGTFSGWSEPPEKNAAKAALGLAKEDYVVGLVAAFRPEKNHFQLVDALASLRAQGLPAKALFVGDGPTRPAVEAYAAERGLGENVVFAGEQGDVRPYIAAMDVGVLCSVAVETFSIAALETMAMSVPMVMSDIGGAAEIVTDDQNGFLFPSGDTHTLIKRLTRLSGAGERQRMGENARTSVVDRYTSDIMAERYEALFDELASITRSGTDGSSSSR